MELMEVSISNIMTDKVKVLQATETVGFALLNMIQNRFTRLPVVDGEDLVGILSSQDLISSIHEANSVEVMSQNLSEIMTKNVITGDVEHSFYSSLKTMVEHQVSCLPLLENNKLRGIFTNKDLLLFALYWRELPEMTIDRYTEKLQPFTEDLAIDENSSISEAIEILAKTKSKILVMQDDKQKIGLVPIQRVLRSISSSLISEGMNMDYLDEKVISRVVAEPLFSETLPTDLNTCRKTLNSRGVESLFLEENHDYTAIINESIIRDLSYSLLEDRI